MIMRISLILANRQKHEEALGEVLKYKQVLSVLVCAC